MPEPSERISATGPGGDDARPSRPLSAPPRPRVVSGTLLKMLGIVLADLTYPARPWQIIVAAEYYGADVHTVTRLRRLPPGSYSSLGHIGHAYTYATGPWPNPPGSRQPGVS